MRILLIDDEPDVTENLALWLEDEFHTVEPLNYVASPEDLKSLLTDFRPEGVVLDFDMAPSGDQIYKWMREWNKTVPIVFYTKYAKSPTHRDLMENLGVEPNQILAKEEAGSDVPKLLRALRRSA